MTEHIVSDSASEVMDKRLLSELLSVSERTIERWIVERRIPYVTLPKRGSRTEVRFLRSTILTWLKRNEVKTARCFHSIEDVK
jgi:excisionase family DNA binding protein